MHAFWESRIPELFAGNYNFIVGKAAYIEDPLKAAWKIVKHSHSLVDSVLTLEAVLNQSFPSVQKYSFSKRSNLVIKQYSEAYSKKYQDKMSGMVEKQMRSAILYIGSFWFPAWIDAGQPELKNLIKLEPTPEEIIQEQLLQKKFNEGKFIGRDN